VSISSASAAAADHLKHVRFNGRAMIQLLENIEIVIVSASAVTISQFVLFLLMGLVNVG
jgi:hypothetical protein